MVTRYPFDGKLHPLIFFIFLFTAIGSYKLFVLLGVLPKKLLHVYVSDRFDRGDDVETERGATFAPFVAGFEDVEPGIVFLGDQDLTVAVGLVVPYLEPTTALHVFIIQDPVY